VILEQFCIANVTAQGVDRLVPGLVHHLEDGRTLGRRGKKSRAIPVAESFLVPLWGALQCSSLKLGPAILPRTTFLADEEGAGD
jgi:hypothetical protein